MHVLAEEAVVQIRYVSADQLTFTAAKRIVVVAKPGFGQEIERGLGLGPVGHQAAYARQDVIEFNMGHNLLFNR